MAPTPDLPPASISRRSLLTGAAGTLGVAALAPLLAACGGQDGDPTADSTPNTMSSGASGTELVVVAQFDPNGFITAGTEQRAVITVVDGTNTAPAGLPETLNFTILRNGQEPLGPPVSVHRHDDGVPKPYYPVPINPPTEGLYAIRAELPGTSQQTLIQASAPKASTRPVPGRAITVVDTPTTTDLRGINPLCTQEPGPCPLHEVNLRDALASGRPTALLISTPRYCQIGVCGPVLALVLEQQAARPDVQFIHAEVFADPASGSREVAPAVKALDLDYEPMLAVIGADGIVTARLDIVFDRAEIAAALATTRPT